MEDQEQKPVPPADFKKPTSPFERSKPIDYSQFEEVEKEAVEHREQEGE